MATHPSDAQILEADPAQAGQRHGGHEVLRGVSGYGRGETFEGTRKPMDGTGTKQGRKAVAEEGVEGVRNSEGAAKPGRSTWRAVGEERKR